MESERLGATLAVGSDSYPYTVIEMGERTLLARADDYKFNPATQDYDYFENDSREPEVFTLRKNKRWYKKGDTMKGCFLYVGRRRAYFDPSF